MIKFLNAPERPEQGDYVPLFNCSSISHSMGPETSLVGLLCIITIYAPMIYTAPCIMFWMRAYPLRGFVLHQGAGQ